MGSCKVQNQFCDGTQDGCIKVLRHSSYIRLRHCKYSFWRRMGDRGSCKIKMHLRQNRIHTELYTHQREVVVSPGQHSVVIRGLSSLLWEDKLVFMEIKSNHYLFLSENTALKILWSGSCAAQFKEDSSNCPVSAECLWWNLNQIRITYNAKRWVAQLPYFCFLAKYAFQTSVTPLQTQTHLFPLSLFGDMGQNCALSQLKNAQKMSYAFSLKGIQLK